MSRRRRAIIVEEAISVGLDPDKLSTDSNKLYNAARKLKRTKSKKVVESTDSAHDVDLELREDLDDEESDVTWDSEPEDVEGTRGSISEDKSEDMSDASMKSDSSDESASSSSKDTKSASKTKTKKTKTKKTKSK